MQNAELAMPATDRPMRLGLFINAPAREGAICAFDLVKHLRAMGHRMTLFAPEIRGQDDSGLGQQITLHLLQRAGWWRQQELDLAIFYGVGTFPGEVLRQARVSGATVVVECDSDGTVSPLQAPWRRFKLTHWDSRLPFLSRLRSAKAWFHNWLVSGKDRERIVLDFFNEADWIKIESEIPATVLKSFFLSRQRADLARKVTVMPFAVRQWFTTPAVSSIREPVIVLAGRLSALQKGPVETVEVLRSLSHGTAPPRIELHIRGAAPEFDALAQQYSNVSVAHDTPAEVLAERLRKAQVVFSRSRWETTPVLGLEALCSGCTLVAPSEVPGYSSLIQKDRFGTEFDSRSTHLAMAALRGELARWRRGARNPTAIASHWREQCAIEIAGERWLELAAQKLPPVKCHA